VLILQIIPLVAEPHLVIFLPSYERVCLAENSYMNCECCSCMSMLFSDELDNAECQEVNFIVREACDDEI
jgi:hypothetical protein